MKKNIAIVAGGDSSEVVVSLKSAQGLSTFIDKESYNTYVVVLTEQKWVAIIDETEYLIDKNDFSFTINGEKNQL